MVYFSQANGILLPSKVVYFSQANGILLPSKWYTSPKQMVYFSQANGILLPSKWYTSPKQMDVVDHELNHGVDEAEDLFAELDQAIEDVLLQNNDLEERS
ncbi:hypothetical protein Tco_1290430 [Tanacetum coccineum]